MQGSPIKVSEGLTQQQAPGMNEAIAQYDPQIHVQFDISISLNINLQLQSR